MNFKRKFGYSNWQLSVTYFMEDKKRIEETF